jgi:hypothetical protein
MERLLELLEKFDKLDRQLQTAYLENHDDIDEIFNNYGLVRKYKVLLETPYLIPIGPEGVIDPKGKSIREEREREKEWLKNEIEGKGISLDKDHSIITLINEIMLLKKEIKKYLYYCASVIVDSNITNKLRKIRNDKGYFIDKIYDEFVKKTELEHGGFDEGYDYITEMYDPEEFSRRVVKVGAFIISKNLPDVILYHIVNLKECFAIGLFQASLFYCRTLIESAGFEFLKRKGKLKNNYNYCEVSKLFFLK